MYEILECVEAWIVLSALCVNMHLNKDFFNILKGPSWKKQESIKHSTFFESHETTSTILSFRIGILFVLLFTLRACKYQLFFIIYLQETWYETILHVKLLIQISFYFFLNHFWESYSEISDCINTCGLYKSEKRGTCLFNINIEYPVYKNM